MPAGGVTAEVDWATTDYAVCDFAADSRHANPWAADLYDQAIARGHRHPHAVRIVARAWLHVIWRCWQDRQRDRPEQHRALQAVLQPDPTAAAARPRTGVLPTHTPVALSGDLLAAWVVPAGPLPRGQAMRFRLAARGSGLAPLRGGAGPGQRPVQF